MLALSAQTSILTTLRNAANNRKIIEIINIALALAPNNITANIRLKKNIEFIPK